MADQVGEPVGTVRAAAQATDARASTGGGTTSATGRPDADEGAEGATSSRRATPLPPDERRAALVGATLTLIREYGVAVSTRQIAEAAGVAEGTIFRVFASKDELIQAAVKAAFDPEPLLERLRGVDRMLPLRPRLEAVVAILQARFQDIFHLLAELGMHRPPKETGRGGTGHDEANARVLELVLDIIGDDRAQLRLPGTEAVRILRLLTFSGSHPLIADGHLLSPAEIVDAVLDGVRLHHPPAPDPLTRTSAGD